MSSPINNFLQNKITTTENEEFKYFVPSFMLEEDEIMDEIKKMDKNELNEMFGAVFLALNQLGDKLFVVTSNDTVNSDFKQKILNYNPKASPFLDKVNDLVFSDIMTSIEKEYKKNGLTSFYNEKFDNKSKKLKNNNF